jgi:wyosine [tRNA(Phe)-imidazoG37] synthetase (radical SAM superfamily)
MLNIKDHSRDSAGMKYVYPVMSRRAGGVSIGINLNTNNACNWACVYCQVPNLTRGGPLPVDLDQLESELRGFLHEVTTGDFLATQVPLEARRLMDIAFSGNGEPTSAPEFAEAVERVGRLMREFGVQDSVKLRLITNGSLMFRPVVQEGIAAIGALNGEIWFKVDQATEAGIERVNKVRLAPEKVRESLLVCAGLAPTWVQTCYFAMDGQETGDTERNAYLEFITTVRDKIKGVHLYGLARPSLQPDASRLSNLNEEGFQRFAKSISSLGIEVVANI